MKIKIRLWVKILLTFIILIATFFIYGRFINTKGFKVNEYTIKNNITDSFNELKIVHISDINYKHSTNKYDLNKIINKINLINPDIVVFTGDLLNENIIYSDKDLTDLTDELKKIKANMGKFAISGEEDKKFDYWEKILNNSNFKILDSSYELLYNKDNVPILIAGIDYENENIESTINYLDEHNIYSILLIHQPDFIDNFDYHKFTLILAGHSLNGYINIPTIKNFFIETGAKKYYENYYKLENTELFVSNGLGTKNLRFRILNKPSFNFYRIKKS